MLVPLHSHHIYQQKLYKLLSHNIFNFNNSLTGDTIFQDIYVLHLFWYVWYLLLTIYQATNANLMINHVSYGM